MNGAEIVEYFQQQIEQAKIDGTFFIHVTDTRIFKSCRRQWNWTSKVRRNLKPIKRIMVFDFGSAIHEGLEVYYNPLTWRAVCGPVDSPERMAIIQNAIDAFYSKMREFRNKYLTAIKQEALNDEEFEEWKMHFDLGPRMLRHYFSWAYTRDNFTPVATELEFIVPLPDVNGRKVAARGKIDFLMQDDEGFWTWDHKTAGSFTDSIGHLDFDEQLTVYNWALREALGLTMVGNVYNELWKAVPDLPKVLSKKNGGRILSTAKDQPVTYELMLAAIEAYNEPVSLYESYLSWLQIEGPKFFRRTPFHRNAHELDTMGANLIAVSRDMVSMNDETCYPNPDRMKCQWCAFRAPCLAMNDGSDVEWILKNDYTIGE